MIKRKDSDNTFLKSKSIAQNIVVFRQNLQNDMVLEIGTGLGILTPKIIVQKAKKVISIDADETLIKNAKSIMILQN